MIGMEQLPAAVDDKMYELIDRFLGQHIAQKFLYEPKEKEWFSSKLLSTS